MLDGGNLNHAAPLAAKAMEKPLRYALIAQVVSCLVVFLLAMMMPVVRQHSVGLVFAQGVFAALLSWLIRLPPWWVWIGGAFVPLAYFMRQFDLPPVFWLSGFVILALVFWRTDASRVPLYMSNSTTVQALLRLLPQQPIRLIDLGCGDGRLLRQLAKSRPTCQFVGYEHAPLTWAWAWLLGRGLKNLDVRYGSFWGHNLSSYDVVYAFLSPAPMQKLWEKTQAELASTSLLVSNSFLIPDVPAKSVVEVGDKRGSILYCYSVGGTT